MLELGVKALLLSKLSIVLRVAVVCTMTAMTTIVCLSLDLGEVSTSSGYACWLWETIETPCICCNTMSNQLRVQQESVKSKIEDIVTSLMVVLIISEILHTTPNVLSLNGLGYFSSGEDSASRNLSKLATFLKESIRLYSR